MMYCTVHRDLPLQHELQLPGEFHVPYPAAFAYLDTLQEPDASLHTVNMVHEHTGLGESSNGLSRHGKNQSRASHCGDDTTQ